MQAESHQEHTAALEELGVSQAQLGAAGLDGAEST